MPLAFALELLFWSTGLSSKIVNDAQGETDDVHAPWGNSLR